MLNTIQFLQALGSNPMPEGEYSEAVKSLDVKEPELAALLNRDHSALAELLGGRPTMFFGIMAPNEEPLDDEEEPAEENPEDASSLSVRLS